jgi:hypothetical protein
MDSLTSTAGIVALIACVVASVSLGLAVLVATQISRIRSAQRAVLGERGRDDLVAHAQRLSGEVQALGNQVSDLASRLEARARVHERRMEGAISRVAVVRYDAYNEMSGRQSSSVALLDDRRNGVVLSSILHREQARLYAKRIEGGASEFDLSPEEQQAVREAASNPAEPPG